MYYIKSNDPQNHVGFVIDKPGDVIDIHEDECEYPPANITSIESEYIQDVVKLEQNL